MFDLVDALCIDQQTYIESGEQVANLRRIYEQCSRVIVYLGADPIRPAAPLRRQPLHELEDYSPQQIITLRDLLQRKYFSRVWVIQELLLAPRVIFRIGNREFWASPRTGCRLTQEVWGRGG